MLTAPRGHLVLAGEKGTGSQQFATIRPHVIQLMYPSYTKEATHSVPTGSEEGGREERKRGREEGVRQGNEIEMLTWKTMKASN